MPDRERQLPTAELIPCANALIQVLPLGIGPTSTAKLTTAVRCALDDATSVLFPVPENTDLRALRQELSQLALPEKTGVLMRTSGSTAGTGKIVALSWECLRASAQATDLALHGPGRWLTSLPTYHIGGFQTVLRSVVNGYEPEFWDVSGIPASSMPTPTTYASVVPLQLQRLVSSARPGSSAFECAAMLVGGAATSEHLLTQARERGWNVVTTYGMTETAGGCVYDGTPIGDTALSIDADGRVALSGSVVALGYLGSVQDSDAFTVDASGLRTHHTRDRGAIVDGMLRIVGRIDDAINSGGLTIEPRVVEQLIAEVFGTSAVVVGIPDTERGEVAVAVTQAPLVHDELRKQLEPQLERGWTPRFTIPLATLSGSWPTTASGKIDRRALRSLVLRHYQLHE